MIAQLARGNKGGRAAPVGPNTYSTSFGLTENPISEGGVWINGAVTGVDWNNVQTSAAQTHYFLQTNTTETRLYKVVGGAYTQLGTDLSLFL